MPMGTMMRLNGMPAAFMAVSSSCSPIFPKEMSEASRMDSGRAIGTSVMLAYQKNLAKIYTDKPLPIKSSTLRQRNCIISTKRHTKKEATKRSRNFLRTYESIFLIIVIMLIARKRPKPSAKLLLSSGFASGLLLFYLTQPPAGLTGTTETTRHPVRSRAARPRATSHRSTAPHNTKGTPRGAPSEKHFLIISNCL